MIEAAIRAKGLRNLAVEVGFRDLENIVHIGTDSSAAKSFVGRQGLGKMQHLELRDLWLQKEVRDGKVIVSKVFGTENPPDLGTKILNTGEIAERLAGINSEAVMENSEGIICSIIIFGQSVCCTRVAK